MKTNLDYYPHRTDSHRHPKFKMLRTIYGRDGWAMEGRFWALNNFIAESSECKLDLSKKRNKGVVALELGLSFEDFDRFLDVLKSEDVELIYEVEPDIFTTKKVEETLSGMLTEREKSRQRKEKTQFKKSSPEPLESSPELSESSPEPNNKVKESKGKEKKDSSSSTLNHLGIGEDSQKSRAAATADFFESDSKSLEEKIPNFKSQSELLSSVDYLFRKYAMNLNTDKRADLEPVLNFLQKPPECFSETDSWETVVDAFVSLKQAKRTDTAYLLGILRRKVSEKTQTILAKNKQMLKNQSVNDMRQKNAEREAEESKKTQKIIADYKDFVSNNSKLFSQNELAEIIELMESKRTISLARIIDPKMAECVL